MTKTMGDVEWTIIDDESSMYAKVGRCLVEAWRMGEIWQVKASGSGWSYEDGPSGRTIDIASNFKVSERGVGAEDLSEVAKRLSLRVEKLLQP